MKEPAVNQTQLAAGTARSFDPRGHAPQRLERSGKRRQVTVAASSVPWRWPLERKDQYEAFDDWHDIAMQIIHRAGASFRLMAVYKKVIRWKEGCIWSSDEELALEAGRCGWKTISREIGIHRNLGIIHIEHGWRVYQGKRLRTRTIRLAIPETLDPEIIVRDLHHHTVNSGPSRQAVHTVSSGPNHTVHSGPITIATIEEGASRDVSA